MFGLMSQGLKVSWSEQNIPRSLWPDNNFCHLVNPPESLASHCPEDWTKVDLKSDNINRLVMPTLIVRTQICTNASQM